MRAGIYAIFYDKSVGAAIGRPKRSGFADNKLRNSRAANGRPYIPFRGNEFIYGVRDGSR